jgi:hypothetical protein
MELRKSFLRLLGGLTLLLSTTSLQAITLPINIADGFSAGDISDIGTVDLSGLAPGDYQLSLALFGSTTATRDVFFGIFKGTDLYQVNGTDIGVALSSVFPLTAGMLSGSEPWSFYVFGTNSDGLTGYVAQLAAANTAPVPVPAAVWMLGSALIGLVGVSRRRVGA